MKKLLTILLFCVLTVGMASVTSAADWRFVIISDGNDNYFFDTQSFRKTGDTTYIVWAKIEFSEVSGQKNAKIIKTQQPVAYELSKYEYNFQNEEWRILASAWYGKNGDTLYSYSTPMSWNAIFPNSIGEVIFLVTYDYYKKNYK